MNAVPQVLNNSVTRYTLPMRVWFCGFGIPGKDALRLAMLLTGFVIVGVIGILIHPFTVKLRHHTLMLDQWYTYAPLIYKLLILGIGYLLGIMLHFDEQKFGYTSVAIGMPIRPRIVVWQRLAAVAMTMVLWTFVVAGLVYLFAPLVNAPRTWLPNFLAGNSSDVVTLMQGPLEVLVQGGAAILIGLGLGSLSRELIMSALGGPLLFIGSATLANVFTQDPSSAKLVFNALLLVSIPISLFLMVKGQTRIFMRPLETAETGESAVHSYRVITPGWRRTPLFKTMGWAITAVVAYSIGCLSLHVSNAGSGSWPTEDFMVVGFGLGIGLVTLLGVSWLSENERYATTFLTYQLPVSRERIFWKRMTVLTLVCGVAGFIFMVPVIIKALPAAHIEEFAWFLLLVPALLFTFASFVGAFVRLFFASRLVASVIALLITGMIVGATVGVADYNARSPYFRLLLPYYFFFNGILATLLILFFIYIAFCRTRLLEQSGRAQGFLALSSIVLLLFLTGVIVVSPVTDLYFYLKLTSEVPR